MGLKYIDQERTSILDDETGIFIPVAPGNRHYDEIVAAALEIADPDPAPPTPDPEPSPAEALMIEKGVFTKAEWLAKVKA